MSDKREELKAKLLARAEAAVDELLKDKRLHEGMSLSEIEQLVGHPEAEFRQAVLEEILALQEERSRSCPRCGGQWRNNGKRRKQMVTVRGETEVERTYYQCEDCGQGYFPPGCSPGRAGEVIVSELPKPGAGYERTCLLVLG